MMNMIKNNGISLMFVFISSVAMAQADCVLGVGLTDDATLIEVFQMNGMQQEKLANLGAELKYRNELLNDQLENVMKRHPQSNATELRQLADKYKGVVDSMAIIQTMIDKRVLALFNEKQYELYLSLCAEASRSPFIVVPAVYNDSIPVKNR
ncbi:hypothetical protein [Maribacter aestuarii]|uniref:hypothetical protein n=1 Tax=Maribacter aestuarii TaxID=1130723 RepID=UPI00248BA596|nr:hypothetical protein [Maribacter aestuarii]